MKKYPYTQQIVVLWALMISACAGGASSQRGTSSGEEVQRQLMQYQQTRLHQRQFYVGVSVLPDLNSATDAAYGEITRQLTWLPQGSQDLLRGLYRVDRHEVDNAGQVHVLAVLDREAASAHLRKLAQEKQAQVKIMLMGCQKQLKAGEIDAAQFCMASANKDLEQARDLFASSRAAVGDTARRANMPEEDEAAQLSNQLNTSKTQRKSAILKIFKQIDGHTNGNLNANFADVLQDQGLKQVDLDLPEGVVEQSFSGTSSDLTNMAQKAEAGYVVVGWVKAHFIHEESGQFFSRAEGIIKVLESTAGRTIIEVSCGDAKGGHINKKGANEKAIKAAVADLKSQLTAKLRTVIR